MYIVLGSMDDVVMKVIGLVLILKVKMFLKESERLK